VCSSTEFRLIIPTWPVIPTCARLHFRYLTLRLF